MRTGAAESLPPEMGLKVRDATGRMTRPPARRHPRGAAMLAVLMFIIVGTIGVTAFIHLMAARLQQTERMGIGVKRHIMWGNTRAVNQSYAYTACMRDNVALATVTSTLAAGSGSTYADNFTWGGITAPAYASMSVFRTDQRASDAQVSFPFNNLRVPPTSDSSVYYHRTTADSDSSQVESLSAFNYFKSYPPSLLGNLFIIHKRATASGTYAMSGNIRVDGRVVIYDASATSSNLRATSCFQAVAANTSTTKSNDGASTLLPENYPATPVATAGYGGSSSATAVTNGTLKLINNTDFTAGSIRHTMESGGTSTWMNCTTNSSSSTNVETDVANGSSSTATQVKLESTVTYAVPTTSPYGYTKSGNLNVLVVRLANAGLKHLRVTSGVEQIVLEGQTTSSAYTTAGTLDPVIIWLEQNDCRDIRFVGENNRPLILALGGPSATGTTVYLGFHGTSLVAGGPLRWRMHLYNEYRNVYFNPPSSSVGIQVTGGIRTNWSFNSTYTDTVVRMIVQRETAPGELELMLPRDCWLEPYFLVR